MAAKRQHQSKPCSCHFLKQGLDTRAASSVLSPPAGYTGCLLYTSRLLMHKREILRLYGIVKQQGYSLIPLSLYFKDSRVKVQVGLCRGKKLYDKRADMAEKAAKRDIERAIKERNR